MKPELAFNAMMSKDLVTVVPDKTQYTIHSIDKGGIATLVETDGSGAVRKVSCEWLKFAMKIKESHSIQPKNHSS